MLTEKSYTLAAASTGDERVAQYKTFFTDVLSAEISLTYDAENDIFWIDENKTVGFCTLGSTGAAASSNWAIQAAFAYGEPRTIEKFNTYKVYASAQEILYYHVSKNKNAIYFCETGAQNSTLTESSTRRNCYLAAKDEKGAWHMFSGNYLFNSQGQFNSQNTALTDTKSPFVATKMVAPDGAKFLELNKLFFATSFEIGSTLVAFDGVPHRVVSVDGANPCFAFPVSED